MCRIFIIFLSINVWGALITTIKGFPRQLAFSGIFDEFYMTGELVNCFQGSVGTLINM